MKNSLDMHAIDNQSIEIADDSLKPPLGKKSHRASLRSPREIGNELAKLYRLAKAGSIDPATATKLTYILATLAKIRVDSELEKRIEKLERLGGIH